MTEYQNCPFCGSQNVDIRKRAEIDGPLNTTYTRVTCKDCGGSGGEFFTNKEAIDAWNRREL